jgi:hypothetical protein
MANFLNNDLVKVLLVGLGIFFLYHYFNKESMGNANYYGRVPEFLENVAEEAQPQVVEPVGEIQDVSLADKPALPVGTQEGSQLKAEVGQLDNKPFAPEDLLPQYDDANEFAQQNPVSKLLKEQNFLVSGYHMGINTVMQSNKIPYHDIRSAPPVPKEVISPFLNSSYEQAAGAAGRRQFEIL